MTVYEQWKELIAGLDENASAAFEEEYYTKEQAVYQEILGAPDTIIQGPFDAVAKRFGFTNAMFAGFMEGINTSLKSEVDVAAMKTDTPVSLAVDFEELYLNMLKAKARWLYTLAEWEDVLPAQRRREITKEFHRSGQAKSQKVDRNAPCPCGSGKKYKKCCGANA